MGGARRVPLPLPASKEAEDAKKEKLSDMHSTPESATKAGQSAVLSSSTSRPATLSMCPTKKADEKPKPVPRAIYNKAPTNAISFSTSLKPPSETDT